MKKTRRFAAFVASVLAVAAMAAPMTAFAAETSVTLDQTDTSSSIVITNDVEGYDYAAYQVFKGKLVKTTDDSTTPATVTYGVLTDIDWGANIDTTKLTGDTGLYAKLAEIKDDDGNYPFTKDGAALTSPSDVATALAEYSDKDNSVAQDFAAVIKNYITGTAVDGAADYAEGKYTLDGLKPGYYFVENTTVPAWNQANGTSTGAYTRYILGVAGKVEVNQKSSIPSVVKKVKENTTVDGYEYVAGKVHDDYNDVADYSVGDTVPFKLYGTMPSTLNDDYEQYRYVFHDKMMPQLTLDPTSIVVEIIDSTGNVKASTGAATGGASLTAGTDYTVVTTGLTDGCTFEVEFKDIMAVDAGAAEGKQTILSTDMVIVSFDATLNNTAVIGLDGQENEVYLEYTNTSYYDADAEKVYVDKDNDGNNDDTNGDGTVDDKDKVNPTDETGRTPVDKVIVFTYELDTTKVDSSTGTGLPGAEFVMQNTDAETGVKYAAIDETGYFRGWVDTTYDTLTEVTINGEKVKVTTKLTSGSDGLFTVKGIDEGTYYLKETKEPVGYNPLSEPVKLTIVANTLENVDDDRQAWNDFDPEKALTSLKINVDDEKVSGSNELKYAETTATNKGIVTATIKNSMGSTLPSTGGMGTTLFYVGGGALALGAGVLLVSKKRMANK